MKHLFKPLEPQSFDWLNPPVQPGLPVCEMPLVMATPESLGGFGEIVTDPYKHDVEIVTWPSQGWRPLDQGSGNQGGHADGIFRFWWEGEHLYGENQAVEDKYLLGWTKDPAEASAQTDSPDRSQLLLWHANYHPDGAQLFYPLDGTPFIAALAKPGDDMTPEDWVAFYFDGSVGVCIHPGVWHEAIIPLTDTARFYDKQGKVHGRVGCDFNKEFGVYLSVPLRKPE